MALSQSNYLQTASNFKQIHDFPLNNSTSKQIWSFPKTKRFENNQTKNGKTDAIYSVPEKFYWSQRATSFGVGNRLFGLGNKSSAKGSEDYHILSEIDQNLKNKSKLIGFGLSWDKCKIVGALDDRDIKKFPGPGQYNTDISQLKSGKFVMKRKYSPKKKSVQIGPGQYDSKSQFGKGNGLFNSVYKQMGRTLIKPPINDKIRRHPESENQKHLPEIQYDFTYQINPKGKFYNSKYKGVSQVKICKEIHPHDKIQYREVGPGYYQAPSDFGIYASSKFSQKKNFE